MKYALSTLNKGSTGLQFSQRSQEKHFGTNSEYSPPFNLCVSYFLLQESKWILITRNFTEQSLEIKFLLNLPLKANRNAPE